MSIGLTFLSPPIETIAKMAAEPERPDIAVLTVRLSRGDEAAFHEFNRLYYDRLLRFLIVITKGREETAREALQLAYVRVARHVRKFETETAFWNWLAMLARNCAIDEMRKQNRHASLLARFSQEQPASPDLATQEANECLSRCLQEALASLPDDDRALLERKYFNGETVSELSNTWQMSEKAMESHLLRIRRKVKAMVLGGLRDEKSD